MYELGQLSTICKFPSKITNSGFCDREYMGRPQDAQGVLACRRHMMMDHKMSEGELPPLGAVGVPKDPEDAVYDTSTGIASPVLASKPQAPAAAPVVAKAPTPVPAAAATLVSDQFPSSEVPVKEKSPGDIKMTPKKEKAPEKDPEPADDGEGEDEGDGGDVDDKDRYNPDLDPKEKEELDKIAQDPRAFELFEQRERTKRFNEMLKAFAFMFKPEIATLLQGQWNAFKYYAKGNNAKDREDLVGFFHRVPNANHNDIKKIVDFIVNPEGAEAPAPTLDTGRRPGTGATRPVLGVQGGEVPPAQRPMQQQQQAPGEYYMPPPGMVPQMGMQGQMQQGMAPAQGGPGPARNTQESMDELLRDLQQDEADLAALRSPGNAAAAGAGGQEVFTRAQLEAEIKREKDRMEKDRLLEEAQRREADKQATIDRLQSELANARNGGMNMGMGMGMGQGQMQMTIDPYTGQPVYRPMQNPYAPMTSMDPQAIKMAELERQVKEMNDRAQRSQQDDTAAKLSALQQEISTLRITGAGGGGGSGNAMSDEVQVKLAELSNQVKLITSMVDNSMKLGTLYLTNKQMTKDAPLVTSADGKPVNATQEQYDSMMKAASLSGSEQYTPGANGNQQVNQQQQGVPQQGVQSPRPPMPGAAQPPYMAPTAQSQAPPPPAGAAPAPRPEENDLPRLNTRGFGGST
jgi:hypothetical protein